MDCGKFLLMASLTQPYPKINLRPFLSRVKMGLALGMMTILSQCTVHSPPKVIVLGPHEILAKPGDTVYSLANQHQVSVRSLVEANKLSPPYLLTEYQKLALPMPEAPAAPPPAPLSSGPELLQSDAQWSDVTESPTDLTEDSASSQEVDPRLLEESQKERSSLPSGPLPAAPAPSKTSFIVPTKGEILRRYGQSKGKNSHGVTYKVSPHSPVKASRQGTVLLVGDELEKGKKIVVISHDDGWLTAYGPLKETYVSPNQTIKGGEVLGKSQGSELYFEMRQNRKPVDPLLYLN